MVKLIRGGPINQNQPTEPITEAIEQAPEKEKKKSGLKLIRGGSINPQAAQEPIETQESEVQQPRPFNLSQTDMSPQAMLENKETAKRVGAGLLGATAQGIVGLPELAGTAVGRGIEGITKSLLGGEDFPSAVSGRAGDPSTYPGYNPNMESPYGPQGAENLQQEINKYQGKDAKQLVGESLGYENLDPQNFGERVIQGIASDLPNILLSGGAGSIGNKIMSSVAANIGSSGAKGIGLGPVLQLAAGIGSQGVAQYLSSRGVGGVSGDIKRASESLYKGWDKYANNARVDAAPYLEAINTAEDIAKSSLKSTRTPLLKDIKDIKRGLSISETPPDDKNPKKLLEYLTGTNKNQPTYKDISTGLKKIGEGLGEAKNNTERKIYDKLYAEFSSILDKAAETNPEVANYLKAKNLDLAYNGQGFLRKIAGRDKQVKGLLDSPIMQSIFGGAGGLGVGVGIGTAMKKLATMTPAGAITGAAAVAATPYAARALNLIRQPEAVKMILKTYKDAALKDVTGVVNNLKVLNNMIK